MHSSHGLSRVHTHPQPCRELSHHATATAARPGPSRPATLPQHCCCCCCCARCKRQQCSAWRAHQRAPPTLFLMVCKDTCDQAVCVAAGMRVNRCAGRGSQARQCHVQRERDEASGITRRAAAAQPATAMQASLSRAILYTPPVRARTCTCCAHAQHAARRLRARALLHGRPAALSGRPSAPP